MKTSLILTISFLYSLSLSALEVKFNLWHRELCPAPQTCLPQQVSPSAHIFIPEPPMNSFSRVEHFLEGHKVIFTLTKREGETPYTSFQMELYDKDGDITAVCSRFEAIETRENIIVGACAGKMKNKERLLGLSLQIP
jgi:hypothetical protein